MADKKKAKEEKPKKPKLVNKMIKGVGDAGSNMVNMAGQVASSVGNIVETTSRKPGLFFADKIKTGEIPTSTPADLAQTFAEWLRDRNKGPVEIVEYPATTNQWAVTLKEDRLLGQSYLFAFLAIADEKITAELKIGKFQNQSVSEVAIVAQEWPYNRTTLEENLSLFVWKDGVQLGKDGTAAEYITHWLVDYTQHQFEKMPLIPTERKNGPKAKKDKFFVGRQTPLDSVGQSILANRNYDEDIPWIISIWGEGGVGKSYLLQQIRKEFGPRMVFAQVDHQSQEDNNESLMALLILLAKRLKEEGCSISNFEKTIKLLQESKKDSADNFSLTDTGEIVKEVGKALGSTQAKNVAKQLGKTGKIVGNALGALNVAGLIVGVGFEAYDRLQKKDQQKNTAILESAQIQEVTNALIDDLENFVKEQRKKYYLWCRPVLAFDSYELIGPLADGWLRTVFLNNPRLQALEPVVLTLGRYDIYRIDSRWSEYQSHLKVIKLERFDETDSRAYLEKHQLTEPAEIDKIYALTGGLPLFLNLVAGVRSEDEATRILAERILEEVEADLHQLFIELAVADGFNLDIVAKIRPGKEEAQQAFTRLSQASFIEGRSEKLHYLPVVKQVLLRYGELQSPTQMEKTRTLLQK